MGEVNMKDAIDKAVLTLAGENPRAPLARLVAYASAFVEYEVADDNIREQGTIVFHPRTGAPIENPYAKVRDRCMAAMTKLKLSADVLWESRVGAAVLGE